MAKIELKPWYFNDKQRAAEEDDHRVLLGLRPDLETLPYEAVRRPLGNVAEFVKEANLAATDARRDGKASDAQVGEVALLGQALRAAQLAYVFKTLPEKADVGLANFMDSQLCQLEGDADALVRADRFTLDDVPRAPGSSASDRCSWAIELVGFFRRHALPSRVNLKKIEALSKRLRPFVAETADEVAITALRDRAYSALLAAVEGLRAAVPSSGVYAVDSFTSDSKTALGA